MNHKARKAVAYCDGSAIGSNGGKKSKIGIGVVLFHDGKRSEWGRRVGVGDNNKGELLAIREVLRALLARDDHCHELTVIIYTDSEYARLALSKRGMDTEHWKVVADIKGMMAQFNKVHIRWVRGHGGHPENIRADRLAGIGSRRCQKPKNF